MNDFTPVLINSNLNKNGWSYINMKQRLLDLLNLYSY